MVLFDPDGEPGFGDYGIQIPVHHSRATKTYQELIKDPLLSKRMTDWFIPKINYRLLKEDLLRVHSPEYVEHLFSPALEDRIIKTFELLDENGQYHRYDPAKATRPLRALFDKLVFMASGTGVCASVALEKGFCYYFGGGMHHAHRDEGKGFCMINDSVIAIRRLQALGRIKKAWIIDVDAHKGDGTASLTREDDSIITLSAHMASGWPLDENPVYPDGKPNPSFIPSNIDIPIESGEEDLYLPRLKEGLRKLETYPTPDLAIVVDGSDPYEEDELPSAAKLKLSLEQMFQRDMTIYNFLIDRKIPAAFLMAGGYGLSSWKVYTRFLKEIIPLRLQGPIK